MPIKNFQGVGSTGVISDVPNFALNPNDWSDANNVRFLGNRIEKVGGFARKFEESEFDQNGNNDTYINALGVSGRLDESTGRFVEDIVAATNHDIYIIKDANNVELASRVTGDVYGSDNENKWDITSLSNATILTNIRDIPQGKNAFGDNSSRFIDLPNWGKTAIGTIGEVTEYWRTSVLRPYKNFLLALGTLEGADVNTAIEYNQRIRWSDITPVNSIPDNWDAADPTRSAGFNDLTDATGSVVDGLPLKDNFIIYTDNEVFSMQFVGGNQVFTFRKVFTDHGILGPGCVANFEGKHFVVSRDDIYVHNGQSYQSVAEGKVKKKVFNEISDGLDLKNIKTVVDESTNEIWVMYKNNPASPSSDPDIENGNIIGSFNRAAVWNYRHDTWTFRDIPQVLCAEFTPIVEGSLALWSQYNTEFDKWDSSRWSTTTWNTIGKSPVEKSLSVGTVFGGFYRVDEGEFIPVSKTLSTNVTNTEELISYVERVNADFSVEGIPLDTFKKVKYVYPQFRGRGDVNITLSESNTPGGTPVESSTIAFSIDEDYKADFRTNSRYLSVKFEGGGNTEWNFTGYDVDFEVGGMK